MARYREAASCHSVGRQSWVVQMVGISFRALWCIFCSFLEFSCHLLHNSRRCKRLCCVFLAILLQTASMQRLFLASYYYPVERGRSLRSGPLLRGRNSLQVVRIYDFDLLLRIPLPIILQALCFAGCSLRKSRPEPLDWKKGSPLD